MDYLEPSKYDPLGRWVHIDDWPDGAELGQYCYTDSAAQGILITSRNGNIHLGYHTRLTLKAVPAQP